MELKQLNLTNLRNIHSTKISFDNNINVFYGENGSGKTSLLESLYLLSFGRSFRTARLNEIINIQREKFNITANIVLNKNIDVPFEVGVEKNKNSSMRYKFAGDDVRSIVQITKSIPLQIMYSSSDAVIEGGPEERRKFIDWGVFHVEHSYLKHWQSFKRCLLQRNAALKDFSNQGVAKTWDISFSKAAEHVDIARKRYINALERVLIEEAKRLLPKFKTAKMEYYKGWDGSCVLEAVQRSYKKDCALKYSSVGPHRADLSFYLDGVPVKQILSRGQLKLFISALIMARLKVLKNLEHPVSSILLLDDLQSELDCEAQKLFLERAVKLNTQIFMTVIEKPNKEKGIFLPEMSMFHVEHGVIRKKN